MSQNGPYSGPPWSHGSSDKPYAEPADPWGDHGAPVSGQHASWDDHPSSIPQQPVSYQSAPMSPVSGGGSSWDSSPVTPRRNTPILILVVALGALIVVGLGATAWLLNERRSAEKQPTAAGSATAPVAGPAPLGSEDARFYVKKGDCVVNEGTDEAPTMRVAACTSGTYEVLDRIKGKTSGKKDAERKCSKVTGYTKWFFYDSSLDDLDFVLCLKERKAL
ncbi:MAG TPA: hypothetical protein VFG35_29610 [Actinoplanes sp.]|nr:hypothetical protein [Actinoplanes sp.]